MRNIYLIIAKQIVEEAGRIIKEARETNTFSFEMKSDNTPVSNIDINPINHKGYIIASANEEAKDSFLEMFNLIMNENLKH